MTNLLHRSIRNAALLLGISLGAVHVASGQAIATGGRGAELSPFALATLVLPDWGQPNNYGYAVGADYTRFVPFVLQPSLEFRFTHADGEQVNEKSYGGGLKLHATVHRLHPYATFLIGHGDVAFYRAINTAKHSSIVYSIGGGADLDISSQWKVRADYTQQFWNLDFGTLTPSTFALGIAYRVPFHNGRSR
jgi:opacity protein-like surface antigen